MKKAQLTVDEVKHIAKLARLHLSADKIKKFSEQFLLVLEYISKIQKLDTRNVIETSQVTGLENVFREDKIEKERVFTQEQALANAKKTYKGYFVVKSIFKEQNAS